MLTARCSTLVKEDTSYILKKDSTLKWSMDFSFQVQEQRVMAVHKLDDEVNQPLFLTSNWWFRFDIFKWVMSS